MLKNNNVLNFIAVKTERTKYEVFLHTLTESDYSKIKDDYVKYISLYDDRYDNSNHLGMMMFTDLVILKLCAEDQYTNWVGDVNRISVEKGNSQSLNEMTFKYIAILDTLVIRLNSFTTGDYYIEKLKKSEDIQSMNEMKNVNFFTSSLNKRVGDVSILFDNLQLKHLKSIDVNSEDQEKVKDCMYDIMVGIDLLSSMNEVKSSFRNPKKI